MATLLYGRAARTMLHGSISIPLLLLLALLDVEMSALMRRQSAFTHFCPVHALLPSDRFPFDCPSPPTASTDGLLIQ